MFRKTLCFFLIVLLLLIGHAWAQKLTTPQVRKYKADIAKLEKDTARLKWKIKTTKSKAAKAQIQAKITSKQKTIAAKKKVLYPKPEPVIKFKPRAPLIPSFEVFSVEELSLSSEAGNAAAERKIGFRHEVGLLTGFYAGATALIAEVRFPLKIVLGPAALSSRLACGLAQNGDTNQRFVPVNFDLLFNYPPGWLSGVENYIGVGVNYLALTTGRKQGTFGGEFFYGVQSEGFGGVVFGEVGFALMRTGFSASQKGMTVLVGYRQMLGL